MIEFKPFKAIRPTQENVGLIASKPIKSYSDEEIEEILEENSKSFLQIIKPTISDTNIPQKERFLKVRNNIEIWLKNELMTQDKASYYIYEQLQLDGISYKGVIGLTSIKDYEDNKIRVHEKTIPKRESIFTSYLKETHIQVQPILLTYNHNHMIDALIKGEMKNSPVLNFTDELETTHSIWCVNNRLKIKQLKDLFERNDNFYVADGHHRIASSERYQRFRYEKDEEPLGIEYYNYVMSLLISDAELKIFDYNRAVKDLNGLTPEKFLIELANYFDILPKGNEPYISTQKKYLSMYLKGEFYLLHPKESAPSLPLEKQNLDAFLLEEYVLKPILNIDVIRDNDRLSFIKGTRDIGGVETLKSLVDNGGYAVAFALYPILIEDLKKTADLGFQLPIKSTYILPKLLSGLTLVDLLED